MYIYTYIYIYIFIYIYKNSFLCKPFSGTTILIYHTLMYYFYAGKIYIIISCTFQDLLHPRYMTDEESCLETDQESYIRTDDEDGGNTEWEENRRRWVNR